MAQQIFSLRKIEIKDFKYFIVGFGALPIGMLYGFLRAYYKLTDTWFLLLFIALAFLCGHYLWIFAKKYLLKNETLPSPISDPHPMHFEQAKVVPLIPVLLLYGALTESSGSCQEFMNELTATLPDTTQPSSLFGRVDFSLTPEPGINSVVNIVRKATNPGREKDSTLSAVNAALQYPKLEPVVR